MSISLATWKHGFLPNQTTFDVLTFGGTSLDAVEGGAKYCEADPTCMSVGFGGIPDTEGEVSLDASIMDHEGNAGSVCFVRKYMHVASIARRVMETTDYIMLAGEGAELFAERNGFTTRSLLTPQASALYAEWKKYPDRLHVRLRRSKEGDHEYTFVRLDDTGNAETIDRSTLVKPVNESHDTIGILAMDDFGKLAGVCTTSGLAFKLHGRVGDSPIIGAGLFVDGEVGAAVATGTGELVMRASTAFHVVELMRQGSTPEEACKIAMDRIRKQKRLTDDMQVGVMCIRRDGTWCARSLRAGFQIAAAVRGTSLLKGMNQNRNTLCDVTESTLTIAP